jgi:cytochrome c oxidase cbb3-type subunit I/II
MDDPQALSSGSLMPSYSFMLEQELDTASTPAKIRTMQRLGVPYPEGYDAQANTDLMKQAESIQANLAKDGIKTPANKEIIAIIAYMQRLGTDIGKEQTAQHR